VLSDTVILSAIPDDLGVRYSVLLIVLWKLENQLLGY